MKKNKIIIAYILIFLSSTAAISFFSYLKVKERLTALESSISALNKEIPKLKEGLVTAKSALEESRTAIDEIPKLKASISGIGEETVQLRDQLFTTGVPVSECGLDYYAQGGIVVDGIAYFTANWTDRARGDRYRKGRYFPYVVSFDLKTFKKLRTYDFQDTYDSSPFIVHKKDGTALIIAHEYLKQRTKAININTGNTEWLSELNQAGEYFFGYSYFLRKDGTIIILCPSQKGLHALSAEDGKELWHIQESTQGAITPCVDQKNELVYYQCDGKIIKLDANSGEVLIDKDVPWPNQCISWNTVLIDDANGYYIATYWYGKPEWDSAIRVFDKDLNLVWERKSLPVGKKPTLTYADGKIVTGTGNGGYSEQYFGDK